MAAKRTTSLVNNKGTSLRFTCRVNEPLLPPTVSSQNCYVQWLELHSLSKNLGVLLRVLLGGLEGALKHSFGKSDGWVGIAGWVIFALGNSKVHNFTVNDLHGGTLAASDNSNGVRTIVCQLNVEGLGEFTVWVCHEVDHGWAGLLVVRPSLHDSRVVHAVYENFLDPRFLELILSFNVAGDLDCRSRRGERTRQGQDDHVLVLGVLGKVDLLRIWESLEELNLRERVADSNTGSGVGTSDKGIRSKGSDGGSTSQEESC